MLVYPGAEEALWEGMVAFADRHFGGLDRGRTFFLNVDQVGDERLNVHAGEGPIGMRDYPKAAVDLVENVARDLGIETVPGLRSRSGSDGQVPLKAGYVCAFLGSINDVKGQTNYHWPADTADNVNVATIADAVELCEGVVRRLRQGWVGSATTSDGRGDSGGA